MAEAPGLKKVKLSEGAECCVIMKLDLSWSQSMEHKNAIAIVTWTTFYASGYSVVSMDIEKMENAFAKKTTSNKNSVSKS